MDIENLRDMCRALPAVTEDIKWGHDLCFSVAGKMFCVAGLEGPLTVSFKVKDDEFDEMSNSPGIPSEMERSAGPTMTTSRPGMLSSSSLASSAFTVSICRMIIPFSLRWAIICGMVTGS